MSPHGDFEHMAATMKGVDMNYIDKNIKEISSNNNMGILISRDKFFIEYCSDDIIAIKEYVSV